MEADLGASLSTAFVAESCCELCLCTPQVLLGQLPSHRIDQKAITEFAAAVFPATPATRDK